MGQARLGEHKRCLETVVVRREYDDLRMLHGTCLILR